MPCPILVKEKFLRAYQVLSNEQQHLVDSALKHFESYLKTGIAPMGLGVKHLGSHTYEFRAGLSLRVVYVVEGEKVLLALLGTHDEVRRFLKRQ